MSTHLNWLDAMIILCLGFGFLSGCKRGVIRQVLGIVGLLGGFVVALLAWRAVAEAIGYLTASAIGTPWTGILAFVLCLAAISLFCTFIAALLEQKAGTTIGLANQALGGVLGIGRSVLCLLLCFAAIEVFWPVIAFKAVCDSLVAVFFAALSLDLLGCLGMVLPEVLRNMILV